MLDIFVIYICSYYMKEQFSSSFVFAKIIHDILLSQ